MSAKHDPEAGKQTVVDPEEKPTEMWAPAAKALFDDVDKHKREEVQTRTKSGEIVQARELEEAATEMMVGPPPMAASDTVKMTSEEAAAAIAEAEAEAERLLLSDTVEVSGEEGEAARQLAEEQRGKTDPNATMVVDRPTLPKLNRECRMCGRKVASPLPYRFRGPLESERGFRCESCNNVFCAAHVVRVSGLLESLLSGARFRCQLCVPKTGAR